MTQKSKMLFDPYYGTPDPTPNIATEWRKVIDRPWIFNPWTGTPRNALDLDSDLYGHLILPPGEQIYAGN